MKGVSLYLYYRISDTGHCLNLVGENKLTWQRTSLYELVSCEEDNNNGYVNTV